jgi:PKD repeat protein
MKLVLKNSKLIVFFLMAIIYAGCTEDVVELPKITAGFTYTLNENTGTVEFINISENATTYSWDFGDELPLVSALISSDINPIKTYINGTYTVILKAMNAAGAVSYFEDIIVINMPLPLGLPMTFDNENVTYSATTFDGVAYEVVENPAPGGSNDVASMVASITNSGAAYEGLVFELGTAIDLTTNNTIKMNFWSDAAVSILIKLEEGTAFAEVSANHTGAGWEELQFTFTNIASYSKLVVFVDGAGTTAGTF